MALSEGFKGFVDMIKGTFNPDSDYPDYPEEIDGDGPFRFEGEYEEGSAVKKPKTDLDDLYPTQTMTTPAWLPRRNRDKGNNVAQLPNAYASNEVTVIEPRSFSESAQIVKKLIDKKTVILHLDLLDKEQSQRTIDFVCGASHALSGSVQKISDAVVIFTPSTVALSVENTPVQSKFAEAIWNKPL